MLLSQFKIVRLSEMEEAERIIRFLLSDSSFDDTRYTPGELQQFRELPLLGLKGEYIFWYVEDEQGQIIGVNCIAENEQKTGGYSWDYIAVHRDFRGSGVAAALIEAMFVYLSELKARYVVTYTCDLPEYAPIQKLFLRQGFELVGRCPDYYYEGEDRLIYYRKLV